MSKVLALLFAAIFLFTAQGCNKKQKEPTEEGVAVEGKSSKGDEPPAEAEQKKENPITAPSN